MVVEEGKDVDGVRVVGGFCKIEEEVGEEKVGEVFGYGSEGVDNGLESYVEIYVVWGVSLG